MDLYINVWVLVIQTFQLSEHTQGLISSDNQGATVNVNLRGVEKWSDDIQYNSIK